MKLLLISFSDNSDHQDTLFGIYEAVCEQVDAAVIAIKTPKVPAPHGEKVHLVDCPERPGLCRKTFNLPLLTHLMRFVYREKFDVIWFESLHVWNLPLQLCSHQAKTFHVIHEVIPHEGDSQTGMVRLMTAVIARLAYRIVLRNRRYQAEMCSRFHIPEGRVVVSELWRRFPAYTPPVHSKEVLFFGRINPYKGAEHLLSLARTCPEVSFRVIGQVSEPMRNVADQLRQLPNVSLTEGYVSDDEMRQAFTHADWLMIPYHSASQSGVVIDAYKYSRPVICFDVGAVSEQVLNGQTGYLIPAENQVAFAEAIRKAISLPANEYSAMSRQAYDFGCAKYAATGAVQRFLNLF